MSGNLAYHHTELAIARDPSHPDHAAPTFSPDDWALDLGGGFGQWFVGLGFPGAFRACLEVDESAVRYGLVHYRDEIEFMCGRAEKIYYPAGTFTLVMSRVALPYMNIPKVIAEARRVLKPGGRFWMTMHSKAHAMKVLRKVASDYRDRTRGQPARQTWKPRLKMWLHRVYVLLNGHLFEHTGRLVPFFDGRHESWQSTEAMCRALQRQGFAVSVQLRGKHTIIEGVRL